MAINNDNNGSRVIYGLPCVGGKTALAPYICRVIEQCAKDNNLTTYISACGGGGKDILSLYDGYFDSYIYNEYEIPLAKLMEALTDPCNIPLIVDEVDKIFESVLSVEVDGVPDESDVRELQLRSMFEQICDLFSKKDDGKNEARQKRINDCSLIRLAAYGVILIFGSVQNNRQSILYKTKDGKKSFYRDLYQEAKYPNKLCEISKALQGTRVINGDCFDIIKQYKDDEKAFIYIDPPYWNCTNDYRNTFDFDMHIKLCELCYDAKCKVMISMHQFGMAPYFLRLGAEENWHIYKTPDIAHTTRTAGGSMLEAQIAYAKLRADALVALYPSKNYKDEFEDGIENYLDLKKNFDKNNEEVRKNKMSFADNRTVHEYVFANFEFSDSYFTETEVLYTGDDGDLEHSEFYIEGDSLDSDMTLDAIFEDAIYCLYKEKSARLGKKSGENPYSLAANSLLQVFDKGAFENFEDKYCKNLNVETLTEQVSKTIENRENELKARRKLKKIAKNKLKDLEDKAGNNQRKVEEKPKKQTVKQRYNEQYAVILKKLAEII